MRLYWPARVLTLVLLSWPGYLPAQQGVVAPATFAEIKAKAEREDAVYERRLGYLFLMGKGVSKNDVEGLRWIRKAAEQGDATAEFCLGLCLAKGHGVPKNNTEAAKWLRKGAEQNIADAQYNLGVFYHTGLGVEKDDAQAVRWIRKAAEQDLVDAQYNLGVAYHDGEGLEKNDVEAYKWLSLASARGDKGAKKALRVITVGMTTTQVAEGQQLAKDFRARKRGLSGMSTMLATRP